LASVWRRGCSRQSYSSSAIRAPRVQSEVSGPVVRGLVRRWLPRQEVKEQPQGFHAGRLPLPRGPVHHSLTRPDRAGQADTRRREQVLSPAGSGATAARGEGQGARPEGKAAVAAHSATCFRSVESRKLAHNPAEGARLPEGKGVQHIDAVGEYVVWTAQEARQFLTRCAASDYYAAFHLALHTGMRRGEICGLRWGDVEWETGKLSIRNNRVLAGGKPVDTTPKPLACLSCPCTAQAHVRYPRAAGGRTSAVSLASAGPRQPHDHNEGLPVSAGRHEGADERKGGRATQLGNHRGNH
jgi:integrase